MFVISGAAWLRGCPQPGDAVQGRTARESITRVIDSSESSPGV
jgi:hypothetical protein